MTRISIDVATKAAGAIDGTGSWVDWLPVGLIAFSLLLIFFFSFEWRYRKHFQIVFRHTRYRDLRGRDLFYLALIVATGLLGGILAFARLPSPAQTHGLFWNYSLTILVATALTLASVSIITGALRGLRSRTARFWIGAAISILLIGGSILAPQVDPQELTKAVAATFISISLVMFLWVEGHIEDIRTHIYDQSKISRVMTGLKNKDLRKEIQRLIDGIGGLFNGDAFGEHMILGSAIEPSMAIRRKDEEMLALSAIRDCADSIDRLSNQHEINIKKEAFVFTWDRLIDLSGSYLSVCDLSTYNVVSQDSASRACAEWKVRINREKEQIIRRLGSGTTNTAEHPKFDKIILYKNLDRGKLEDYDPKYKDSKLLPPCLRPRLVPGGPCVDGEGNTGSPGPSDAGTQDGSPPCAQAAMDQLCPCDPIACDVDYPCVVKAVVDTWLRDRASVLERREENEQASKRTIVSSTRSHFDEDDFDSKETLNRYRANKVEPPRNDELRHDSASLRGAFKAVGEAVMGAVGLGAHDKDPAAGIRFWLMHKDRFRLVSTANANTDLTDIFRGLENSDVGLFDEKFIGEELKFNTTAGDNGWMYYIRLDEGLAPVIDAIVREKVINFGFPLRLPQGSSGVAAGVDDTRPGGGG